MEEIKDFYISFYRLEVKDIWELIGRYDLTFCSMAGNHCSYTDKHFTVSFSNLFSRLRSLIINESTLTQFQLMGTQTEEFVPDDGI